MAKKYTRTGLLGCVSMAVMAMSATSPAFAQDEDAADETQDVIISVGTRRAERSAKDSPAPVDVIGGEEFLNQGDTDLQNLLRTSVPSYNVNTQPISDAATLIRPANLRGLAPDSTLVLVNGKRRHRAAVITFLGGGIADGSQGPDISVIPAIALKQVEVLRDGAASQYGSDAIAGVMNFVLKEDDSGGLFEAQWGQTYEGDGDQFKVAANVGLPLPIGEGGFVNLSGEYSDTGATSRSVQRDDAAALIAAGNTAVANPAQIWGAPEIRDDFTIFVNSAIPFSEQAELYAFGNYSQREAEGGFFFRNPTNRGGVYSNDGGATLLVGDLSANGSGACPTVPITGGIPDPAGVAALQASADCFSFIELFPGGFTPRFGGQLEDKSVVAGLRGEVGGIGYDLSATYGRNDVDFFINNTINASLGPNTPTEFNPGGYSQEDLNFNADFTYGVPVSMFASDLGLAFGFEHRREKFTIRAGQPESFAIGPLAAPSAAFPAGQGFSSSSNGFGGFTTGSAGSQSQSNYAIYFDAEADVTDTLIVQAAVRYEDFYDSFGGTTNWKVGGRWQATDTIAVRSTYSTGFHAPTAGQANVVNITTAFTGGVLQDQGTFPLSSPAGQFIADRLEADTGVRPELGPEESKNFTAGIGMDLGPIDLTIDYFNIRVDNRISISDQQDFLGELQEVAAENSITLTGTETTSQVLNILDGANILTASDFAGSEDLSSFGFFTNSFDTRTQGIDIVASTDLDLIDGGNTKVSFVMNWTDTDVTDRGLDGAAPLSLGRLRQIEENIPNWRGNVTVNHFQGPFRGLVRLNYFGSFFECHLDDVNNDPGPGSTRGCGLPIDASSQFTVDLEAAMDIIEGVQVIAGAQNVFDSYPDENPFAGIVGSAFPPTAPNGFGGGFYYFKVRASF